MGRDTHGKDYRIDFLHFVKLFNAAITNIRLYSTAHPQAGRYLKNAFQTLTDVLRTKPEITVLLVDDTVVLDKSPLKDTGAHLPQFARILKECGIQRLTFGAGVQGDELKDFIEELASRDTETLKSSASIKLGKVDIKIKQGLPDPALSMTEAQQETAESLKRIRDLKYEELKTLYDDIQRKKTFDARNLDGLIRAFIQGFSQGINPLALLASLKSSDEYTFTHVVNVCILTMSQAEALGFAGKHLYNIGIASALHDVGKLFIPEGIINKPGQLSGKERKIIETHAVRGARYILQLHDIPKLAVLGALEHHIKYDGTGYPAVSSGWKPNIVSQMISIADVFDAMRSRRSYSHPQPVESIVNVLKKGKGTTFNPLLVENFLKLIKK